MILGLLVLDFCKTNWTPCTMFMYLAFEIICISFKHFLLYSSAKRVEIKFPFILPILTHALISRLPAGSRYLWDSCTPSTGETLGPGGREWFWETRFRQFELRSGDVLNTELSSPGIHHERTPDIRNSPIRIDLLERVKNKERVSCII